MAGVSSLLAADSGPPSLTGRSLPSARVLGDGEGPSGEKGGAVEELAAWLVGSWDWDWFFTGTFADATALRDGAPDRRFAAVRGSPGHTVVGYGLSDRFFREWAERRGVLGGPFWFRGREANPRQNGGTHFHALIGNVGKRSRRDAWADWFSRHGQCRIEPIRSYGDVARYVAKYVMKQQGEMQFSENAGLFKKGGTR